MKKASDQISHLKHKSMTRVMKHPRLYSKTVNCEGLFHHYLSAFDTSALLERTVWF